MKLFIWDLHGTLEQGNELAVVELSNKVASDFGYKERFTEQMGKDLYGLHWYEYFEHLLPKEPHERHLELQNACFKYQNTDKGVQTIARHIKPSKNAHEMLGRIQNKHQQVLLSNTPPKNLPVFLEALNMTHYFDKSSVFSASHHLKNSKTSKSNVMKKYLINKDFEEIIVVGDSDKDMQLAEDIEAKAILYAHEGTDFRSSRFDYRINDLLMLRDEL